MGCLLLFAVVMPNTTALLAGSSLKKKHNVKQSIQVSSPGSLKIILNVKIILQH
jgi:hypothetical protein